jgi:Flp pilus assembly protein TadD
VPRLLLAETLFQVGHSEEAEENFRRVHQSAPDDPRALFGLGMTALARDDLGAAQEFFTRAAASPLARQRANRQLATVYGRLGNRGAAAECLRQLDPSAPDPAWPDSYAEEVAALSLGREAVFRRFTQLEQEGRFDDLMVLVQQFGHRYPDGSAYTALGEALWRKGRRESAEQALRQALDMAPNNLRAHELLVLVLFEQGERLAREGRDPAAAQAKYRAAADDAGRALAFKPDLPVVHSLRGLALLRLDERAAAIEALRTAVHLRPEWPDPHLYLGEALAEEKQWEEAEQCLRRAAERAGADDARPRQALERLRANRDKKPGEKPG